MRGPSSSRSDFFETAPGSRFYGRPIWLHQVSLDYGLRGHAELGSATGTLNVLVDDVDAHHDRSAAAGATIVDTPTDLPYGQREYAATDGGGRLWSFATTI